MEIQQLRYFVVTAEELHFKRASARLQIAQPSLTEQIQRLEEELSVRLLDRNSHRVVLTSAGEAFLGRARRILRSARLAAEGAHHEERAADRVDDHAGHLRIAYVCPAARELVPAALRVVRATHPAVAVSVREAWSARQIEALIADEIDVGFVFGGEPDLRVVLLPVLREEMSVLLPTGHPLADRGLLHPADLVTEPLILFTRALSPVLHDRLCAAAADRGVALDVRHAVTDATAALLLAEAGHGLAVVTTARAAEMHSPDVVRRPLAATDGGASPTGPVFVAWRRGDRAPAARTFLRAVRALTDDDGGHTVGVADTGSSVGSVGVVTEGPAWNCAS